MDADGGTDLPAMDGLVHNSLTGLLHRTNYQVTNGTPATNWQIVWVFDGKMIMLDINKSINSLNVLQWCIYDDGNW